MEATEDYEKLEIDPIFEPIKKLFEFYVLGLGFVGQFDFQKLFIQSHAGLKPFLDRYNAEVSLRRDGLNVKSDAKKYWISLGRFMAIALFEILQSSRYQNVLCSEDIFKFAKHIRNGAAHNNKFNIEKLLKKPVQWRDKIITNSLNDTLVFPEFIDPTSLIFLMSDISDLIKKEKGKRKIKEGAHEV